jgi:hypothetical protein
LQPVAPPCDDAARMDDLVPGTTALDPPVRIRVRGYARRGPQRPRLAGLSGLALFACMFLPAVNGCHDAVMPYEAPPFLPPYLYGLVFALIALSRTPRGVALGVLALRTLGSVIVIGSVLLVVIAPPLGIIELLVGGVLVSVVGLHGTSEARLAAAGVAVGALSAVWFGCWALTPVALTGVYASLASAVGLLLGCAGWLRELASRPAVELPLAIAAGRRR